MRKEMPHFKIEILSKDGMQLKVIETKYIEIKEDTVDKALAENKVEKLKKEAKNQGFGVRVKLEE